MAINFLEEAREIAPKLNLIREELHENPEIGKQEFKTAEIIEKYLDEVGISHRRVLDTGIVASLDGALPGKNSALRSDIDALPINEETGITFASKNPGFMHACGHDVHMTGVLGAAMILAKHKKDLRGTVTFIFQPDEEGEGGADRMIKAGAIDGVDAVFGAHVDPALPAGYVGIRYGNFYASSAMFKIIVLGKSAHGAQRDKGIDAIEVSAHIIPEVLKIPGGVVSVCMINAGTAGNVLASQSEFRGIIRTFGVKSRERMCREFEEIAKKISESFGAKCECIFTPGAPGIINDNDDLTALVENTARETLGSERVHVIEKPLFTSEDFGFYITAKTGNFYHIGAGCEYPLHSDKFLPQPEAFITAAAVHAAIAYKFNLQDW